MVITKCNFNGISVYIVNVYIPTTTRDAKEVCHNITYRLHVLLGEKGVKNLVVCGDFNATGAKILTSWLSAHGFKVANDDQVPTHSKGNVLDFVCTTGSIDRSVILGNQMFDHAGLAVRILFSGQDYGQAATPTPADFKRMLRSNHLLN